MIASSAVKILDLKQNKEIIIPCHRHHNAFYILHEFGYSRSDFKVLDDGFLDNHDNFLTRIDACAHAMECGQIPTGTIRVIYSEDLW